MDEFITRLMWVLRRAITAYREGRIDLNTLVQRIEGVSSVVELKPWSAAVFPITVEIEQINAMALDSQAALTSEDQALIEAALQQLELRIQRMQTQTR